MSSNEKLDFESWLETNYRMTREELSKEDKRFRNSVKNEYTKYWNEEVSLT